MKVVYRVYESDQGLEDIQAKIYTEVSGLPATAEQIKQRNDSRAPEMTRYALTENGEPLAYVTARDSISEPGRTYIGYPWAMPDCPSEVQERIFEEHMKYLKKREETNEIGSTVVVGAMIAKEQLAYMESKGFVESDGLYRHNVDYDSKEVSKWKLTDDIASLTVRSPTNDDIDLLVEVCQSDPNIRSAFPTVEAFQAYFKERVLKDGHASMIFDGDQIVAAGALLKIQPNRLSLTGDEERVILRFLAIRPGYTHAWKRLMVELAKENKVAGWAEVPIRVGFSFITKSSVAKAIAQVQSDLELFELILVYQE